MDSQAQLLVRDQESFLFLETPSRKLLLPSTRLQAEEDFATAAKRYISEVKVLPTAGSHVERATACGRMEVKHIPVLH